MATQPVYQFYAELEEFKPKIWRRFQVAGDVTVAKLGYVVMTMFEMKASHLFSVEHERPQQTPSGKPSKRAELVCRYALPSQDGEWDNPDDKDATKTPLSQLNLEASARLLVWYDFGDDWRVVVTPEEAPAALDVPKKELPRVLEGQGHGIVEDCGGIWGLADLAQAFKEKKGAEYEQLREWLGVDDFDITAFDIADMNFRLKKLPRIYAGIYEKHEYPTQRSIDLIERKYLKK